MGHCHITDLLLTKMAYDCIKNFPCYYLGVFERKLIVKAKIVTIVGFITCRNKMYDEIAQSVGERNGSVILCI